MFNLPQHTLPPACIIRRPVTPTLELRPPYPLFNERYWAPVFASQVLTEEPGLTWVAFTLNSSTLYDTPNTQTLGTTSLEPGGFFYFDFCIFDIIVVGEESTPTTRGQGRHELHLKVQLFG